MAVDLAQRGEPRGDPGAVEDGAPGRAALRESLRNPGEAGAERGLVDQHLTIRGGDRHLDVLADQLSLAARQIVVVALVGARDVRGEGQVEEVVRQRELGLAVGCREAGGQVAYR